ncbi:MAG: glycosyltransferase family 2 protein [Mesonia hippocampi]|uniref:Glycosyltransferase 2-like domain-containing protein n=1 Tax=Mesonia hippocampi TaxID=1628250 RepID=A0A840EP67_9FLAO|nr:glycosyltransferase family 2 protein [Mesonia hippocampi]MBB4119928.1 hypothetical protein [Mesonia hippocampi]
MKTTKEIAVVILNWNGRKLLETFLPSVVNYSPEAQLYVADNASTDDSVDFLQTTYPEIQIIQLPENGGYAKGYNQALQQVNEPIHILLNSDVEVSKNWLPPILAHFKNHPETAIAQPKILDYKKPNYFEYAGAAGGFIDKLGYPYCRGRIFDTLEEDTHQYNNSCPIFWASGACLVIRKEVFLSLNGFDEDYFAHQEEIDLCWRAFNKGFQSYYIAESTVYHLGGATLSKMNAKKTFLNFRNSLYNLLKNVATPKAYFLIFIRLCLDGLAGVFFLCQGKPKHTLAIIHAHFSFYKNSVKIYKKRNSKVSYKPYSNVNALIINYFIKSQKNYKNLK